AYLDSLALTEELFDALPARGRFPRGPFDRLTMEEAFVRYAGFSLERAAAGGTEALAEEARQLGLDPAPGLGTAALYDLVFIHAVEPCLRGDRVIALLDYPAFVPTLAKKNAAGGAERWECYYNGIELANCYSEEDDCSAVRAYFEAEGKAKAASALVPHDLDDDYWRIFTRFPRCSGVALGVDRLIMALWGVSGIDAVLPFPGGTEHR
ncbi:MAG: LysR family transcriptional regulator, partial [Treponema sp.]|nr:LysR family transcriptional regulator [Treponema sp.]